MDENGASKKIKNPDFTGYMPALGLWLINILKQGKQFPKKICSGSVYTVFLTIKVHINNPVLYKTVRASDLQSCLTIGTNHNGCITKEREPAVIAVKKRNSLPSVTNRVGGSERGAEMNKGDKVLRLHS